MGNGLTGETYDNVIAELSARYSQVQKEGKQLERKISEVVKTVDGSYKEYVKKRTASISAAKKSKNEATHTKATQQLDAIAELNDIKRKLDITKPLAVIDGRLVVNAQYEKRARALLKQIESEPEELKANYKYIELLNKYLKKLESKKIKSESVTTTDGKTVDSSVATEYEDILKSIQLLQGVTAKDFPLEKSLDLVYLPAKLKEDFEKVFCYTDFYTVNYLEPQRNVQENEEIIVELEQGLRRFEDNYNSNGKVAILSKQANDNTVVLADDVDAYNDLLEMIEILKDTGTKLKNVCSFGNVKSKYADRFKELIKANYSTLLEISTKFKSIPLIKANIPVLRSLGCAIRELEKNNDRVNREILNAYKAKVAAILAGFDFSKNRMKQMEDGAQVDVRVAKWYDSANIALELLSYISDIKPIIGLPAHVDVVDEVKPKVLNGEELNAKLIELYTKTGPTIDLWAQFKNLDLSMIINTNNTNRNLKLVNFDEVLGNVVKSDEKLPVTSPLAVDEFGEIMVNNLTALGVDYFKDLNFEPYKGNNEELRLRRMPVLAGKTKDRDNTLESKSVSDNKDKLADNKQNGLLGSESKTDIGNIDIQKAILQVLDDSKYAYDKNGTSYQISEDMIKMTNPIIEKSVVDELEAILSLEDVEEMQNALNELLSKKTPEEAKAILLKVKEYTDKFRSSDDADNLRRGRTLSSNTQSSKNENVEATVLSPSEEASLERLTEIMKLDDPDKISAAIRGLYPKHRDLLDEMDKLVAETADLKIDEEALNLDVDSIVKMSRDNRKKADTLPLVDDSEVTPKHLDADGLKQIEEQREKEQIAKLQDIMALGDPDKISEAISGLFPKHRDLLGEMDKLVAENADLEINEQALNLDIDSIVKMGRENRAKSSSLKPSSEATENAAKDTDSSEKPYKPKHEESKVTSVAEQVDHLLGLTSMEELMAALSKMTDNDGKREETGAADSLNISPKVSLEDNALAKDEKPVESVPVPTAVQEPKNDGANISAQVEQLLNLSSTSELIRALNGTNQSGAKEKGEDISDLNTQYASLNKKSLVGQQLSKALSLPDSNEKVEAIMNIATSRKLKEMFEDYRNFYIKNIDGSVSKDKLQSLLYVFNPDVRSRLLTELSLGSDEGNKDLRGVLSTVQSYNNPDNLDVKNGDLEKQMMSILEMGDPDLKSKAISSILSSPNGNISRLSEGFDYNLFNEIDSDALANEVSREKSLVYKVKRIGERVFGNIKKRWATSGTQDLVDAMTFMDGLKNQIHERISLLTFGKDLSFEEMIEAEPDASTENVELPVEDVIANYQYAMAELENYFQMVKESLEKEMIANPNQLHTAKKTRLQDLRYRINFCKEKIASILIRCYEEAKEHNDFKTMKRIRCFVLDLTFVDIEDYLNMDDARDRIRELMCLSDMDLRDELSLEYHELIDMLRGDPFNNDSLNPPRIDDVEVYYLSVLEKNIKRLDEEAKYSLNNVGGVVR